MSIERRELEIAGLKAHFYSPKGGGRSPAVIAVHGGGWQQGARNAFQRLVELSHHAR